MAMQGDVVELLTLLDSGDIHVVKEVKSLIQENLHTNKEGWLLYGLMDHYLATQSEVTMDILANVSEPHDKHLFEKLNENIKATLTQKLQVLTLLGYIVYRQPPWLYKIVNQPVLSSLIKCLKNDLDVPILMSGVLIVTSLLPVIPVSVAPYLDSIVDVFHRLADFITKKPAGNVPEVYLLHLQVGVYALFHRLYGMYPCRFLSGLRAIYNKRENQETFTETIRPMLERIKVHPLLVTSSKESEVNKSRWYKMEAHDIIVECAKISLDPAEGSHEDSHCPIVKTSHVPKNRLSLESVYSRETMASFHPISSSGRNSSVSIGPTIPEVPESIVSMSMKLSNSFLWSPAQACGLSTPPANSPTPTHSMSEVNLPTTAPYMSMASGTSHTPVSMVGKTPQNTPVKGTPGEEGLYNQTCTPTLDTSVPPSPMKRDFTTEPPLDAHQLKAQRVLLFRDSPNSQNINEDDLVEIAQEASEVTPKEMACAKDEMKKSTESVLSVKLLPLVIEKLSDHVPDPDKQQNVDEEVCHINNEDVETSGSSGSCDPTATIGDKDGGSCDQTAANESKDMADQVAKFMKTINRIRFNSMNVENSNNYKDLNKRSPKRSTSCPVISEEQNRKEDIKPQISTTQEAKAQQPHYTKATMTPTITPAAVSLTTEINSGTQAAQRSRSLMPESNTTTRDVIPPRMAHSMDVGHPRHQNRDSLESNMSGLVAPLLPYFGANPSHYPSLTSISSDSYQEAECGQMDGTGLANLFPLALPYTCITQCGTCADRAFVSPADTLPVQLGNQTYLMPRMTEDGSQKVLGHETPFYLTLSPPELIDRYIGLGCELHAKQLSAIPLTSQNTINWTHFGGSPPTDEVNILRGQNVLLHTQMMYERHKREMHAQRNRRLLRKINQAAALEEQNIAQADQLKLQEDEINKLHLSLRLKQEEFKEIKESFLHETEQQETRIKSLTAENDSLVKENDSLQEQIDQEHLEKDSLLQNLQSCQSHLFELGQEFELAKVQVSRTRNLEEQVKRLNKELMLMGELQKRYQEKVTSLTLVTQGKPETLMLNHALKVDLECVKKSLAVTRAETDGQRTYIHELEDGVRNKDLTILDLKQEAVQAKDIHKEKNQVLEERYKALKEINKRQDEHIIELTDKIDRLTIDSKGKKPLSRTRSITSELSLSHDSISSPVEGAGTSAYNRNSPSLSIESSKYRSIREDSPKTLKSSPGSASAFSTYQPMASPIQYPSGSRSVTGSRSTDTEARQMSNEMRGTRSEDSINPGANTTLGYDDSSSKSLSQSDTNFTDSGYR